MRKLATIRQIKDIIEIPKADNIELVLIDGWQCVAKKGEFAINDLCVYFEIDSRLPTHRIFEFMQSRKFKVKTIKCMKQVSQGLALPITILSEFTSKTFKLGDDVTEIIGVTHIDRDCDKIQIQKMRDKYPWWKKFLMKFKITRNIIKSYEQKSTFPSHIVKKTDEERIQNLSASLYKFVGKLFQATEKLDGQSATYIYRPNYLFEEFLVCSRNQLLKNEDNSSWWTVARQLFIKNKLKSLHKLNRLSKKEYIIIQGEILGVGIQKNKYKVTDYEFYIFNMITGNHNQSYENIKTMIDISKIDLKQVPYRGCFKAKTESEFMKHVEELGAKKSIRNPNIYAEGIVCRTDDVSFKYINPKFLLKFDD